MNRRRELAWLMPAVMVALSMMAISALVGCANRPRIDPSGRQLLIWDQPPMGPPVATAPAFAGPVTGAPVISGPIVSAPGVSGPIAVAPGIAQPGLTLTPTRIVAPVGTEVLMVAGTHDQANPLTPYQRVEWMLSPGSVGQFLAVGESDRPAIMRPFTPAPQKVSNDYAVGETHGTTRIITRGTVDPSDDVSILPGQAWVTVSSPVEGSSFVTAFAPELQGTVGNRQSGVIHWVDARWQVPVSATVEAGGRHTLTTTVTRQTTGGPASGYRVRYEVVSGPAAGFGPALNGGVELTTNEAGLASAELSQRVAQAGVTVVNVQLVRPGANTPGSEPLILGSAQVQINWGDGGASSLPLAGRPQPGALPNNVDPNISAPPLQPPQSGPVTGAPSSATPPNAIMAEPQIDVRLVGPERAIVGEKVQFRVDVTNRGTQPARGLVIYDRFDSGFEHSSVDKATKFIQKKYQDVGPGQTISSNITFNVVQAGRLCHKVELAGDGKVLASANACLTATPAAAAAPPKRPFLTLKKTAPKLMRQGEEARFVITIENTGDAPVASYKVTESAQRGIRAKAATDGAQPLNGQLIWDVREPLLPGQQRVFEVSYVANEVSESTCSRVTVTDGGDLTVADEICLKVAPPGFQPLGTGAKLSLKVADRSDPVRVGTTFSYVVLVKNEGTTADRGVALTVTLPDSLDIQQVPRAPARHRLDGRVIRFDPIAELRPGETMTYEIMVKANRAGQTALQSSVTSQTVTQPILAEDTTQVL